MERLAFLDQVTQLPNRRYLEMSMRTALEEFHVHHDPFGLLVIDLDRFKAVNDDFGHAIGDQALLEAGKTLTAALRATDIVGRWGGDEFTAIVHHANPQMLRELAERCCVTMSKTLVPSSDDAAAFMSVSVGGTLALSGDTSNGLFKRADALMYQSKTNGRGRALVDQSYEIAEMSLRRAARA
jgi:diguanylate cyclase (GGDEF)-like protein